jgi:hypothetical protein
VSLQRVDRGRHSTRESGLVGSPALKSDFRECDGRVDIVDEGLAEGVSVASLLSVVRQARELVAQWPAATPKRGKNGRDARQPP